MARHHHGGSASWLAVAVRLRAHTAASRAVGRDVLADGLGNLPEAFALSSDGVYTVETKDLQRVVAHLLQPEQSWEVLPRKTFEALPTDSRAELTVVESALSQDPPVLVTNRGGVSVTPSAQRASPTLGMPPS